MDAEVPVRREGGCTIVEVAGEIDVHSAPQLHQALSEAVAAGVLCLVVDLEAVEFMDSSGLGVLVGALKRTRSQGGSLHLVCSRQPILKLFRVTGLTEVFPIHATLAEAVAAATTAG
jgi:anti-sigma B factor antagonist